MKIHHHNYYEVECDVCSEKVKLPTHAIRYTEYDLDVNYLMYHLRPLQWSYRYIGYGIKPDVQLLCPKCTNKEKRGPTKWVTKKKESIALQ